MYEFRNSGQGGTPLPRRWIILGLLLFTRGVAARAEAPPPGPLVDDVIGALIDAAPLAMRFRGGTAVECRKWQQEFRGKLAELLGPHDPPKKWRTVTERVVELADHTRYELLLVADGHPTLPVYLLIPHEPAARRPGVVAVHGHGATGYDAVVARRELPGVDEAIERANYDYGLQLVRRGYVVAAPCLLPFGRRIGDRTQYSSNDPCAVTYVRLQLLGRLLMAENLRDVRWCVSLLSDRADVDPERIGCVGLSYGGRMTMLAAALDQRIRVAVPSGAINCMQERIRGRYAGGCQVIPGLLQYGDVPEIGSLIAPRHLLWEAGTQDDLLPHAWIERAMQRMTVAYQALGAEENLHLERFDGGHRWNGQAAYQLLDDVLHP